MVAESGSDFAQYAAQVVSSPFGKALESPASPSTNNVSSLNSQLLTHGWAKRPLALDKLSTRDHNDVVAVMFELLGASLTDLSNLDNLAARHRTLTYEHERVQKQQATFMNAVHRLEAEVSAWKGKCEEAQKKLKDEKEVVRDLREEISRSRKAMDGLRAAAAHDAKKSQLQLDKAQAQLLRLSNETAQSPRSPGLILLNPIPGSRSHPIAPSQGRLVEQSVKDLAEIRANLQEESDAFRHVAVSTGNALREVLALAHRENPPAKWSHAQFFAYDSHENRSRRHQSQVAPSDSHASIADARLSQLVGDVIQRFEEELQVQAGVSTSEVLGQDVDEEERKRTTREAERVRQELEDRLKDLEVEVICARAREEKAERVVEELTRIQTDRESTGPRTTDESDDDFRRDLMEQEFELEEERRKFAEATVRLGQERRHLETERAAFLEERRRADLDAMHLPTSPLESPPVALVESNLPLSTPGRSSQQTWTAHRPILSSPLAIHKPRTPKQHSAGKRKVKTPLSRLVLEKGLKAKDRREEVELGQASPGRSALGSHSEERLNIAATKSQVDKGKQRTDLGTKLPNSDAARKISGASRTSARSASGNSMELTKRAVSRGAPKSSGTSSTSVGSRKDGGRVETAMAKRNVWR